MNSQRRAWARGKGMQIIDGNTLAGWLDHIPVSIEMQNKSLRFLLSLQTDARQAAAFSGRLRQYEPEFGTLRAMSKENKIVVLCSPKKTLDILQLNRLTGLLLQEAREAGLTPRTCCERCGKPARTAVLRNRRILVACGRCLSDAERNASRGSFLTGLAGALLGAAFGAVPCILLTMMTGFYMGFFSLLIGLVSFAGYRLLGGRRNERAAFGAVLLATLFAVFVSQVICYLPSFAIQEMEETVRWYLRSLVKGDQAVISNALFTLLCASAGVGVAFLHIKRYVCAEQVRELAHLPPAAGQAANSCSP